MPALPVSHATLSPLRAIFSPLLFFDAAMLLPMLLSVLALMPPRRWLLPLYASAYSHVVTRYH